MQASTDRGESAQTIDLSVCSISIAPKADAWSLQISSTHPLLPAYREQVRVGRTPVEALASALFADLSVFGICIHRGFDISERLPGCVLAVKPAEGGFLVALAGVPGHTPELIGGVSDRYEAVAKFILMHEAAVRERLAGYRGYRAALLKFCETLDEMANWVPRTLELQDKGDSFTLLVPINIYYKIPSLIEKITTEIERSPFADSEPLLELWKSIDSALCRNSRAFARICIALFKAVDVFNPKNEHPGKSVKIPDFTDLELEGMEINAFASAVKQVAEELKQSGPFYRDTSGNLLGADPSSCVKDALKHHQIDALFRRSIEFLKTSALDLLARQL